GAKRGRDASPRRPPKFGRARIADAPAKGCPAARPYPNTQDARGFAEAGLPEYRLTRAIQVRTRTCLPALEDEV
ncbi:MAG TPA: hypothetical protein PK529_04510, partial [Verrucomicrobiales bacterium]|nr:hypothetical protein [Verrucomicrobiales bacterium]